MKLPNNGIGKDVFLMSSGTIIAQSINVLIQPILTRIVSPETLGIYTYIISLATMIIPVASLKIDMLIVSERDDREAQYITDVCILICMAISLLYAVVVSTSFLFGNDNLFTKYGLIIFFVPIIILTNGIRFLFISYNNRYKQYKLIAGIGILREGAKGVIQVISGFLNYGVLGQVFGYAIATIFGFRYQIKEYSQKLKNRKRITCAKMKDIIFVTGRKQILYLVPAQFVNAFSHTIVIMSIASLYSPSSLGYYSAGARLLEIPLVFITANVSKVCYRQVSEMVAGEKKVFPLVRKLALYLFAASVLGFALLYAVAPPLSEFVFGKGYHVAGEFMKCLCIMYIVRFVASSFSGLFTIFGKQNLEFYLNLAFVIFAASVFVVCKVLELSVTNYLWLIAGTYSLIYATLLLGYLQLCKVHDRKLTQQTI